MFTNPFGARPSITSITRSGPPDRLACTTLAVAGRRAVSYSLSAVTTSSASASSDASARVEDSLTRAVGAVRMHGMCGITQQGHPAERPMRDGIAIAHGILVEFLRRAYHLGRIDCREAEYPLDVRQDLVAPARPAPILPSGRRLGTIANLGINNPVEEV